MSGMIEVRVRPLVAGAGEAAIGTLTEWLTLRAQDMTLLFRLSDLPPDGLRR